MIVTQRLEIVPATLDTTRAPSGPPSADGTVEVGYAIVADRQRRG